MFAFDLIGCVASFILVMILVWMLIVSLKGVKERTEGERKIITFIGVVAELVILTGAVITIIPEYQKWVFNTETYNQAQQLETDGNYLYAYWSYCDLGGKYPTCKVLKADIERTYEPGNYAIGELYTDEGQYYAALLAFNRIPDYRDAELRADECMMLYLQEEHPDWFQ